MNPQWSQMGSQNGPKTVQNEVLEAYHFKAGSEVASRPPQGSVLERFGNNFGVMFCLVRMHVGWFLHALVSNRLNVTCSNLGGELKHVQQMLGESISHLSTCEASCATSPVLLLRSRVGLRHDMIRRRNNRLIDR